MALNNKVILHLFFKKIVPQFSPKDFLILLGPDAPDVPLVLRNFFPIIDS
jgi:hypothetical protein